MISSPKPVLWSNSSANVARSMGWQTTPGGGVPSWDQSISRKKECRRIADTSPFPSRTSRELNNLSLAPTERTAHPDRRLFSGGDSSLGMRTSQRMILSYVLPIDCEKNGARPTLIS